MRVQLAWRAARANKERANERLTAWCTKKMEHVVQSAAQAAVDNGSRVSGVACNSWEKCLNHRVRASGMLLHN